MSAFAGSDEADVKSAFGDSSPSDWKYIAEGALNLALRYSGNDTRLKGFVLRVRKDNPKAAGSGGEKNPWAESMRFVDTQVLPFLGRRYVQQSIEVPLREGYMKELGDLIEESRPEKRRKHPLNAKLDTALLMVDNTMIPTGDQDMPSLCFELKLKCGFIPNSPCITHEVKKRKDRFSMHEQIKFAHGDLSTLSAYSPYELFSYDPIRVRGALEALVDTPQNNFRLFVDGVMVYPDDQGLGDRSIFDKVLAKFPKVYELGGVSGLLETLTQLLCAEPLLERIKRMQMLDDCDIEGAYACYQAILARGETIRPLADLDHALLPRPPPAELPAQMTPAAQHETLQRFLLSCTAKDCSTMIVMKPSSTSSSNTPIPDMRSTLLSMNAPRTIVDAHGYKYSIAVVDLDPKPLSKMQHWYEMDKEIAEFYTIKEREGRLARQKSSTA